MQENHLTCVMFAGFASSVEFALVLGDWADVGGAMADSTCVTKQLWEDGRSDDRQNFTSGNTDVCVDFPPGCAGQSLFF
eukprot:1261946-Pyramimonas_sp.AAC.1